MRIAKTFAATKRACVLLLVSAALCSSSALAASPPDDAQHARIVQGQFDSKADQASFQQALAKAFGDEVKIENPAADPSNGDGAANDSFGISVALSGDTAVVGAYGDGIGANGGQGSAYVFTRSGTVWSQQAKLSADDGAAIDLFGISVALSGDTVVVGAREDDIGANTNQGSAYVFTRSGTVWSQQAKLSASDGAAGDMFGISVALSGDTAVVGASGDDIGANPNQGSAYVFTRSGSVWSQQAQLSAGDGAVNDAFGSSVALSGDTAVVGAHQDDIGANPNQGSAYVFTRSGTVWSPQTKLSAGDGAAGDMFGISVALSGDTAVVGALWDDIGANVDQGSAYVFTRSGTVWSQQTQLSAGDGAAGDNFGGSVALSGDTAVVGASGDDIGANANQGSAYVFTRSGTVWNQQAKLSAGDGAADDSFGDSVALSGDTAVVGALWDDSVGPTGNPDVGSIYLYRNRFTVTPSAGTGGSISPAAAFNVYANATTTLTVTPDAGYSVVSVSGCGGTWGGSNPYVTGPITADCTVTAQFANDAPTIAAVGDRNLLEDSGTTNVTINVSDLESAAATLVVTAVSNNTGLIPNPSVSPGASDSERVVSFAPVAQQNGGPVTITLTIVDPVGANSERTFAVTVTAVNDAPALSLGTTPTHAAATAGAQSQSGFASVDLGPDDEDVGQAVADYLIDNVNDPDGVLTPASVDIANNGTLTYTLTGVGGSATITARVRDNGGVANGGNDTSSAQQFTISVTPGADLQIAKTNHRSGLLDGEIAVYAIVVANAGPNAVTAASVSDPLPATLINASWMCVQALSTATCPSPDTGTGNLGASIDLGVNQYLRFDVMAEVDGVVNAFVTNTATIAAPGGVTALNTGNDSATDQDPIVPVGLFADGFETSSTPLLGVPGAAEALQTR
jgi:uncharacterized repeat protein (TIGR01451 family)